MTQWLFLVPAKGGIGSIFHPPEGKDYKWYNKWYILPIGGLYATYHLLGEPETSIESTVVFQKQYTSGIYIYKWYFSCQLEDQKCHLPPTFYGNLQKSIE